MRMVLALAAWGWAMFAYSQETLVQRLEASKDCDAHECTYRAGNDLKFTIVSIGEANAAITFERSSFDGYYWANFLTESGCVVVLPGKAAPPMLDEVAFVSPKTGKVYSTRQECKRATK
jgi:hypothetical protein